MIGHEPDGTDEDLVRAGLVEGGEMVEDVRSRSQGSPVGDSLWNENDQSCRPAASATSLEVSSSWSSCEPLGGEVMGDRSMAPIPDLA